MKDKLTLALLQTDMVWQKPEENCQLVEQQLEQLNSKVDIIVLPEMFTTAFCPDAARLAEPTDGPTLEFAKNMARKHDALFVATWPVVDGGTRKVYNRMHLVSPTGEISTYDKRHTFRLSNECRTFARGESLPQSIVWQGWRIRPAVCYDLRFPTWLRNSYDTASDQLDYDLLLLCANWPTSRIDVWDTLLRARAIENLAYVVGVNRTGIDADALIYNGHSAVIDFKGQYVQQPMVDKPCTLIVTLDREDLNNFRHRSPFYLDFD